MKVVFKKIECGLLNNCNTLKYRVEIPSGGENVKKPRNLNYWLQQLFYL